VASGDKVQIVLEARDEMTQEISKVRKSIKGLETEQARYAKEVESGNLDAADSYERVRKEIQDQKLALERLRQEQRIVAAESKKLIAEETRARVQARLAAKQQAQAMQGVARLTASVTGTIKVQTRAWDVLKMKVSYVAAQFKARWIAAIDAVKAKMATLRDKVSGIGGSGLASLAKGGMMAGGAATAGLGIIGFNTASQLEQSQIALEQMLGSAKKAGDMMAWLKDTAAKTPFELSGLTQSTQRLLAFGFTAKEAQKNLMVIGDAASATGKGQEGIDQITNALGQMQAKGKISGEEMLQLTEAGIPAWEILSKKMGMTVPQLQAMVESQGGAAKLFGAGGLPKLIDGMGEKYDGLMGKQSQTLGGLMSTLKDTVSLAAADMVKKYLPQIKRGLKSLIDGVGKAFDTLSGVIDKVGPAVGGVITFISDNKQVFLAAAGAIGVMTVAMMVFNAVMAINPVTLIIMAIGALIGLLVLAYKKVGWFRNAVQAAWQWIQKAVKWFVDWFKKYAWPVIRTYLKLWWTYISKVVWPVIKFVFKAIWGVIKLVCAYISKIFWPTVRRIFGAFITANRAVWDSVKTVWGKIVERFRSVKDRIGSIIGGIKDFFKNLWSGLTEGLPNAIQTMKDWLSKIPGLGAILDGLLFTGGPVMAGGTYMVGELGPELFVPKTGSPYMIGESGPEVRDFHTAGFVVPNHLLSTAGAQATLVQERVIVERDGASAPLVGQMVVRDESEAIRRLEQMQARQRRLERERT